MTTPVALCQGTTPQSLCQEQPYSGWGRLLLTFFFFFFQADSSNDRPLSILEGVHSNARTDIWNANMRLRGERDNFGHSCGWNEPKATATWFLLCVLCPNRQNIIFKQPHKDVHAYQSLTLCLLDLVEAVTSPKYPREWDLRLASQAWLRHVTLLFLFVLTMLTVTQK